MMANTYTQIHIQVVIVVKYRECLIHPFWEEELHKYITGIIRNYEHKVLQINGIEDHIHILFGLRPKQALSDLMREVKEESTKWINRKGFLEKEFKWQKGYGAFSYSKDAVPRVATYIQNQKEHHRKKKFIDEYIGLLDEFEIEYDERFIFNQIL
jgi:putative transposase